ncbi:hypothetical protein QE417_004443 [Mucilaginibacter terrae]|uniref:Uncharacterized protein n=1 Tax=Mucilaginibacter terrae TaxID=1955052 RepID=A0ABU3H0G7_9SPHI|nr:hypothetical protein [Mucilaginibacter terrae]
MILGKGYQSVVKGKTIETTTVVMINNNVKGSYNGNFKTVLDRVIASFSIKHNND